MLLALLGSFGEPALLGETLPEPREGAVEYLRDATLRQLEDPADLLEGEALVVVEGGDHPLLLAETFYGTNQPRADLGHLRGGGRVGRRAVSDEVVQPGARASLALQAGLQRPDLRPGVLFEKRPVLRDADTQASYQLRLRRLAAQLLEELVPGPLRLVGPQAGAARERIDLPQLVEDGPPDLGDRIRLELGTATRIVGLDRVEQPEQSRRDDVLLI